MQRLLVLQHELVVWKNLKKKSYHGQHVGGGRVNARSEVVVIHDDLLLRAVVNGTQHLDGHFVTVKLGTCTIALR